MDVRLIASDLDGTLFGPGHVPEARTVAAVNAAVDAGLVFAAVTGRSHFGGVERVAGAGARAHWFIGSNGGHRMHIDSRTLEERLIFSAAEMEAIVGELPAKLGGEVGFGFEHEAGFTYDDAFRRAFPEAFDGGPRSDSTRYADHDVGKIFISHPELGAHDLIAAAEPHTPPGVHVSTSGTSFVEITPPGGDKALGLARLCDQLDIDADQVIAFGDNNNDVSMLRWAGRGISMANATPDAKAASDETTLSNVDYGVAVVLEALIN